MTEEESLVQSYLMEQDEENNNYSPYCTICNGCGESGCCRPTRCTPDNVNCAYPKSNTSDLKLGYRTFEAFWDLLEKNDWFGKKEEFMKLYDNELDYKYSQDEE